MRLKNRLIELVNSDGNRVFIDPKRVASVMPYRGTTTASTINLREGSYVVVPMAVRETVDLIDDLAAALEGDES